jgi:hypothetical protein
MISIAIIHHTQRYYLPAFFPPSPTSTPPPPAPSIAPAPNHTPTAASSTDLASQTDAHRPTDGGGGRDPNAHAHARESEEAPIVQRVREAEGRAARLQDTVSLSLALVEAVGLLLPDTPHHPRHGPSARPRAECRESRTSARERRRRGDAGAGGCLWIGEGDENAAWVGARRGMEVWGQMVWEARGGSDAEGECGEGREDRGGRGGGDGGGERRKARRGGKNAPMCPGGVSLGYLQVHLRRGAFLYVSRQVGVQRARQKGQEPHPRATTAQHKEGKNCTVTGGGEQGQGGEKGGGGGSVGQLRNRYPGHLRSLTQQHNKTTTQPHHSPCTPAVLRCRK